MTEENTRRRVLQLLGAGSVSSAFLSQSVGASESDQNAPRENFGIDERTISDQLRITNNDSEARTVSVRISRKTPNGTEAASFEKTYDVPPIGTENFGNVISESVLRLGTPGTHVVEIELDTGDVTTFDWHVPTGRVPDNRGIAVRIRSGEASSKPVIA